jgi:DNA-binding MarR family transcriptional regulator
VKTIIESLNKAFESRIRLAIMSALMVNDSIDFNSLKEMLDITDGNLASHITVLENNNYIKVKKKFIGKKPLTTYSATEHGRKEFSAHLDALEKLIKQSQQI